MADTKITALAAISTIDVNPATSPIPIVDLLDNSMAASGTTKKVTVNQILGSGGTATLASATITGDLTVATNKLKVDTANSRVGINTTTFATDSAFAVKTTAGKFDVRAAGSLSVKLNSDQSMLYNVPTGNSHLFQINDSDAMTLNATGLGVGMSPVSAFNVGATGGNDGDLYFNTLIRNTGTAATSQPRTGILFSGYYIGSTNFSNFAGITGGKENATSGNSAGFISLCTAANGGSPTARLTVDSSGNVGIGVTPSAWTSYKALQVQSASIFSTTGNDTAYGSNFYYDGAYRFRSASSDKACMYSQFAGQHQWHYTASAGTAGNVATFTQAMTLDASGNLLVGKTATNSGTVGVEIQPNGNVWATKSASTSAATAWDTYSTGAAAYRFYVGMDGTVNATNTTISAISDARLKENVQDIDVGLGAILALKPRKFDWKAGKGKDIKGDRGFIAQEFEQVFPQLVDEWKDPAPEGEAPYKSVRQDLIPVLVKAIQELTARVQTLEAK